MPTLQGQTVGLHLLVPAVADSDATWSCGTLVRKQFDEHAPNP